MKLKLWYITQVLTVSVCNSFEQNRPTVISKPAPLSQAEGLKMTDQFLLRVCQAQAPILFEFLKDLEKVMIRKNWKGREDKTVKIY